MLLSVVAFSTSLLMAAAEKHIVIEMRSPKSVTFTNGGFMFVGDKTAEGSPLRLTTRKEDGTTNIFQKTIIPSSVYNEHRYAVIISPEGRNGVGQVFLLATNGSLKACPWSPWRKPDYLEDDMYAVSNFMDNQKSPTRSTNVPPNCFEVRYKIEDSK